MAETKKVGSFDVMRVMSERDMDIRHSGLENITNMQLVHKGKDTNVTIGFPGDILNAILHGKLVGGFILCDKEQFDQIKKELEAEAVTHG